jgi:hypothetical protein
MKVILMIDATRPALSNVETVDRYLDMIDYLWKQDELDYITTLQQLTDSIFQIIMDDGMSIDGILVVYLFIVNSKRFSSKRNH